MTLAWLLLPALAFGHSGRFEATALVGDPPVAIETTHGVLVDDDGWGWVCPAVFEGAQTDAVLRLKSGRLLVTSTAGVHWSDDGCTWTRAFGVREYVSQLGVEDGLWGLTAAGLIRSEDRGETWFDVDSPGGLAARAVVRLDAAWAVAGWSYDERAVVWVGRPGEGWTEVPVPFEIAQRAEPLGVGPDGWAWFNYPIQGEGTLLRASADGVVEELASGLGDVGGLRVSGGVPSLATRRGLLRSDDGGRAWAVVDDVGLNCIGAAGTVCLDASEDLGVLGRWEDGWRATLTFDQVAPLACSDPAPTCAAMWDSAVAASLPLPEPPVETEGAVGCSAAGGGGWILLGLIRRRRGR